MELLYRRAEWMTVMQGLMAGSLEKAEQESLTKGWKLILTNQFHDIIPGSSIHEVYEDCHKDYAAIEEIAVQVEEDFTENTALPEAVSYTHLMSPGHSTVSSGKMPFTQIHCQGMERALW